MSDIKKKSPYSFDEDGIDASKYKNWTGVDKNTFDNLLHYLSIGMRNSSCRSIRDALAMFLILLRCNLKQSSIADMFGTLIYIIH